MAIFHQYFPKLWYEQHWSRYFLNPVLIPLSWLYATYTSLRRIYYRYFPGDTVLPVIVVGNLTVGGTGKTPFVIYLVRLLQHWGWRPGVITRGYGGLEAGPLVVGKQHSAAEVGDETVLLAKRLNCPVVKAVQRNDGIELLSTLDCDIVVSDDGLQHLSMNRQVEIILLDGHRQLGNRRLLPAGPLRESHKRVQQAHLLLKKGDAGEGGFQYQSTNLCAVGKDEKMRLDVVRQEFASNQVYALAGIANPQNFFDSLTTLGLQFTRLVFPDHHAYTQADLPSAESVVIMTEKDAVKCQELKHPHMWYLGIEIQSNTEREKRIKKLIEEKIGRSSLKC